MYLNCHTYYSLRYGTFSEIELLELAKDNNVDALALTDINNTSACLNFIRKAKEFNIKPVIGIDFRNGNDQLFVGIAKNNEGFKELNQFLSYHSENDIELPDVPTKTLDNCYLVYPFEKVLQLEKNEFKPNEFIGVSIEELKKLRFSKLLNLKNKLVVQQQVTIRNKRDFNAHRLLRSIDKNCLLSKLDKSEECLATDKMHQKESLEDAFKDFTFILNNTKKILDNCTIDFSFGNERVSQNLKLYTDSSETDFKLLESLCFKNLNKRYTDPTNEVLKRLNTELHTIKTLGFVSFFLVNYDIVNYAKSKGYFHVGRGSGANSIVAYIIGITDVDPIELDLYFERFINPFRASPPDFDIDFSWKDRDDVTAYIFKRFNHTALMATYNTFKYRAVVRELGKVFGLPKEEIDKLSKGNYRQSDLDELSQLVLRYGKLIEGFPNYLSVHSAGIIILDKPVHYYSATDLPPKGFPTVQFDMIIAEDVGIFKFDILGQRGLAKIKDALEIIKTNRPEVNDIDITNVEAFKTDKNINQLLKTGGAIGAYYVESPAMRGLMQQLQTEDYLGLVAASSIIRPGVSGSGMKDEYIRRHRNPEKRKDAHPILLQIMPETYGVMVYQEDVLKVANQFADLTLGEADILRRGMSGKYRSRKEFLEVEQKFISNCRNKGFEDDLIFEVWNQIKSFAGYAFAKGHSASYAVESYQSLFLKCYYPLEFMTAVLNNGGGFYSTEHYLHEAKQQGAKICLPCINRSDHPNRLIGSSIYLGFGYLKNLETYTIQRILSNRQLFGAYKSLDDFIDRVSISIEQLTILIRINAFRFTKKHKTELLWQAIFKLNAQGSKTKQAQLFKIQHKKFELPKLKTNWIEDAYDEMELLGFPLCNYFNLVSEKIHGGITASEMKNHIGENVIIYGSLVTTRFNRTSQGKLMRLSTFIDQEGKYFDAVHFSDNVDKFPINGLGVYMCYGSIKDRFGFYSMVVVSSKKMGIITDPRNASLKHLKSI
ncbi:DNA polymerase III subunit alpha [Meridianimaribacter sp. CL38]|uniref:DNA polymerase III subunit alpha n=1 Tax=Meridianimaribacter sp. CL38 TaxID=2213021 RepID=UPI00103ADCB9|nr:DNA polymerase III subunit alpha [Meridianimaribacter sp. CL38]TBV25671.1 DNA polymerase III subunit alpha [Meridianimaribacter sp. CL38]